MPVIYTLDNDGNIHTFLFHEMPTFDRVKEAAIENGVEIDPEDWEKLRTNSQGYAADGTIRLTWTYCDFLDVLPLGRAIDDFVRYLTRLKFKGIQNRPRADIDDAIDALTALVDE